jgi:sugar phosphate isomerase/epimerase
MQIGVQTFTVRKAQKKNLEKAYLPLIAMGVRDLEIARIKFDRKNALEVRRLMDAYGIRVAAIQAKPKDIYRHPEMLTEFCRITGCGNIVISMLPFHCILGGEKLFYRFVDKLDEWYDGFEKQGITLSYHHHNWEYVTLSNGKTRMDELLARTEKIRFVHDTYWTARSGRDPVEQIRAFGDKLTGIHLRDLTFYKKGLEVLPKDTALGQGVIDFSRVLRAAEQAGCRYCAIEQKTDRPYDDLRISWDHCKKITAQREV